jgi:hypothetical protein
VLPGAGPTPLLPITGQPERVTPVALIRRISTRSRARRAGARELGETTSRRLRHSTGPCNGSPQRARFPVIVKAAVTTDSSTSFLNRSCHFVAVNLARHAFTPCSIGAALVSAAAPAQASASRFATAPSTEVGAALISAAGSRPLL